jgi:hypothetical protein
VNDLLDPADRAALLARIESLRPDAPAAWGRMDPARALAHAAAALEAATGVLPVKRKWIGYLLGPLVKGLLLGPRPFSRNAPTAPEFLVPGPRDFATEKARLLAAIERFAALGRAGLEGRGHALVGPLTGEQWGRLQGKHLDHHLRQFGA